MVNFQKQWSSVHREDACNLGLGVVASTWGNPCWLGAHPVSHSGLRNVVFLCVFLRSYSLEVVCHWVWPSSLFIHKYSECDSYWSFFLLATVSAESWASSILCHAFSEKGLKGDWNTWRRRAFVGMWWWVTWKKQCRCFCKCCSWMERDLGCWEPRNSTKWT